MVPASNRPRRQDLGSAALAPGEPAVAQVDREGAEILAARLVEMAVAAAVGEEFGLAADALVLLGRQGEALVHGLCRLAGDGEEDRGGRARVLVGGHDVELAGQ